MLVHLFEIIGQFLKSNRSHINPLPPPKKKVQPSVGGGMVMNQFFFSEGFGFAVTFNKEQQYFGCLEHTLVKILPVPQGSILEICHCCSLFDPGFSQIYIAV